MTLLNTVTDLLQSNPYVVVISLDFSKAFDTVRHSTLLAKMAELDLPVPVYNWIVDFFEGHTHRTVFNGEESLAISISASIIQGSGIGPASYAVTAADLRPMHSGNSLVKFADDTYLVVPSANVALFRLRNDLYCVEWGVKLYSLTHAHAGDRRYRNLGSGQ